MALVEMDFSKGVGASEASKVSFNNAGTGLDADNVQDAITEVNSNFDYSEEEHIIGKLVVGGVEKTICTKVVRGTVTIRSGITQTPINHGITGFDKPLSYKGYFVGSDGYVRPLPMVYPQTNSSKVCVGLYDFTSTNFMVGMLYDGYPSLTSAEFTIILEYTKN